MMKRAIAALLACVLILSLAAGCSDEGDKPEAVWPGVTESGDSNGKSGNGAGGRITDGGSESLRACEALAAAFMELSGGAEEMAEKGLLHHSYYEYGRALAAVSAMRHCVDELLITKGETTIEDGRLADWDAIGAYNFTEWSVWLFEGIALQVGGDVDAAKKCFANAAVCPGFDEEAADVFLAVARLSSVELKTLRQTLAGYEDALNAAFTQGPVAYTRDEYCFSGDYLIGKGLEALEIDPEDSAGALTCFEAAMRVSPDNADAFAAAATLCLYEQDMDLAAFYINQGLFIAPEHIGLLQLLEAYNGAYNGGAQ